MQNLLAETLEILAENNKTEQDVLWVGNETHKTTWEKFKAIANIEYDNSYGRIEVAIDLVVVGDSWWLEREEYDGSEWWAFRQYPKMPTENIDLKALTIEQAQQLGFYKHGAPNLLSIHGLTK